MRLLFIKEVIEYSVIDEILLKFYLGA